MLYANVFKAYRTDEGKPYVLPVVRTIEAQITADHTLNHEYLPIAGLPDFRTAAARLLLGENCRAIVENRVSCTHRGLWLLMILLAAVLSFWLYCPQSVTFTLPNRWRLCNLVCWFVCL